MAPPWSILLLLFAVVPHTTAYFRLPSPWGWKCNRTTNLCEKFDDDGVSGFTTLNQCKLTCGLYGVIWPQPKSAVLVEGVNYFLPTNVSNTITCQGDTCSLLQEAIVLFKGNLNRYHPDCTNGSAPWKGPYDKEVKDHQILLDIRVTGDTTRLGFDTDESYSLSVKTLEGKTTAVVAAASFFGARHGLETLSQLVEYDELRNSLQIVSNATIEDAPAFKYRGILLDTSRNFFSVKSIERTLDAMAANKLNTFHWHITDSHSYPLYLDSLPKMAWWGAYTSRQVYTPADVRHLVQYGRVRGIRVLPEFDAPAHVGNGWQWGEKAGLGKLAVCVNREPWQSYCVEPPCGQFNLANPKLYDVLDIMYKEWVDLFSPLDSFHYGGDEVNLNCWNTTDEITQWMDSEGFGRDADAYYQQWSVFQEKTRKLVTKANGGKEVPGIIWTSHLTEAGHVDKYLKPEHYIIQIWTKGDDPVISELLQKGYRLIFSNYDAWYLDCGFGAWVGEGNNWCSPYKGWQTVYDNSPTNISRTLTANNNYGDQILGGEAALWSEQADEQTLDERLWPRGSALAERLWTNPNTNWEPAEFRLIHQRQRLVNRGIRADRIQPQWCHQNEGLCYLNKT